MSHRPRLDVAFPEHGWVTIRLTAGDVDLTFHASSVPDDPLAMLAEAGNRLAAGDTEVVVTWNAEPVEFELRFAVAGGRCLLEVREASQSGRAIAAVEAAPEAFARAIWESLRRLQGRAGAKSFEAAWRRPFPEASVARLGKRLRRRPPESDNSGARR